MARSKIRVLVVDDHEPWCRFVCSALQKQPEYQVVNIVSDGLEAVQRAEELKPDLILLDIGLPTLNGIEAARRIRSLSPLPKILFASTNRSWDIAREALRTGAGGYLVKADAARELLPAVKAVLEGIPFLSIGLTGLGTVQPEAGRSAIRAQQQNPSVFPRVGVQRKKREVRLYEDDAAFVDGFAQSIAAALRNGNVAVVVATEADHAAILLRLDSYGVDVAAVLEQKRYVSLDIANTHSTFVVDTNRSAQEVSGEMKKALRTAKESRLSAAFA